MPASSSSSHTVTTRPPPAAGVQAKPLAVAELVRRLAEAEGRLHALEDERASDAELIGNLLAGVADRDRRLRQLEGEVARARGVFDDVLRALSARHDPHAGSTRELGELLSAALGALDLTRSSTSSTAQKVDEARTALGELPEIQHALDATLARARHAHDAVEPVERAISRVAEHLRDVERRERELGDLRAALRSDTRALLAGVTSLQGALDPLAADDEARRASRRKPSRLPMKRR